MLGLALSMAAQKPPIGGGAPAAYTTGAVSAATNVNLANGSFTLAPSALGLLSLWVYPVNGVNQPFWASADPDLYWNIYIDNSGKLTVDVWDDATNNKEFMFHVTGAVTQGSWQNVLIGIDTNHAAGLKVGKVTVNGTAKSVVVDSDTASAFTIGWGHAGQALDLFGAGFASGAPSGYAADYWLGLGQYADVADSTVIAKFISGGKPVNLGADGSTPTGTAPAVFLRRAPAALASTFATNLGTGGNFAITGTLTTAPSSPSD